MAMPTGLTADTTKLFDDAVVGEIQRIRSGGSGDDTDINGAVLYFSAGNPNTIYWARTSGSGVLETANGTALGATGDSFTIYGSIPIAEWAGSSVNLSVAKAEYAFNTSVTDADDTASFGYGPSGQVANYTFGANREKTVRFLTDIQPTDHIVFQGSEDRINWHELPFLTSADATIGNLNSTTGVSLKVDTSNNTDVIVLWGRYRTGTTAWSAATLYWRVVKYPGVIQTATLSNFRSQILSVDNLFTSGSVKVTRQGTQVTISEYTAIGHGSAAARETTSGFLPTWARPPVNINSIYIMGANEVRMVTVETDGTFKTNYRDWAGSTTSASATSGVSITYNVAD